MLEHRESCRISETLLSRDKAYLMLMDAKSNANNERLSLYSSLSRSHKHTLYVQYGENVLK